MRVMVEKEVDADMNITKDTKLKDLLTEYPWLKEELSKVNEKFKMLGTPMGKIILGKADIAEMSRKSGMDAAELTSKLTELIRNHQ